MRFKRQYLFILIASLGMFITPAKARAEDLACLYGYAHENDPSLQAAKAAQLSARQALPLARSQFLAVINGTATYNNNWSNDPFIARGYHQDIYALNLTQPILNFTHWAKYKQANAVVKEANATYSAAEQDLIIRLARAYFEELQAIDNLFFAKAQLAAFDKSLDQTEQRSKVGLIASTDVEIARARHDNAFALKIAAEADVLDKNEKLREIVGFVPERLAKLRLELTLPPPEPTNVEEWVKIALEQNFLLQAQRFKRQASWQAMRNIEYGHMPSINAVSSYQHIRPNLPFDNQEVDTSVGIQVNIPIFNGGNILSQTKQARYDFDKEDRILEKTYRETETQTRQSFRGVFTQIEQTAAFKRSVISNQSAVNATEASFTVGTRTIVDVLNSQSDLIKAKSDFATARYNYIIQSLLLKQAAGTLCPEDLCRINRWLVESSCEISDKSLGSFKQGRR